MKNRAFLILVIFVFFGYLCYGEDTLTGKEIAVKMSEANVSTKGIVIKGKMIMSDMKKGNPEERSYISLNMNFDGVDKMLFRFSDSSLRGTTFLTLEDNKGRKLQYIYLNSIGSPRQVASSDKEANFVDTDISNEDLGGFNIEDYEYKRLEDRAIKGMECYVIERAPKDKGSKYSKHLVIVEKEHLLPIAVKSYSRDDRVVKVISMDDIRKVEEDIYMPFKMKIKNMKDKHQTEIIIKTAEEKDLNKGYFNKNRMDRKWAEED